MDYQKTCETRYKKTAEFLQAVGLESKSISYDRISVLLEKREWIVSRPPHGGRGLKYYMGK